MIKHKKKIILQVFLIVKKKILLVHTFITLNDAIIRIKQIYINIVVLLL